MATATGRFSTLEEFEQMTDDTVYHELSEGELIESPFPYALQSWVKTELLRSRLQIHRYEFDR